MLKNDEEFKLKINSCVENMPSKKKSSFQSKFCGTVCLSLLTKQSFKKARHKIAPIFQGSENFIFRIHLHLNRNEIGTTTGFLEKSLCKLAQDERYPNKGIENKGVTTSNYNTEDIVPAHNLMNSVASLFNRNAEIFDPQFSKF